MNLWINMTSNVCQCQSVAWNPAFLAHIYNPESRQGPGQGSRKGQQSFMVWDITRYHLPRMVEYSDVWQLPVNMGLISVYFAVSQN